MYGDYMKALEIAKYIITKYVNIGKPISNLKLQKLLYFVQGLALCTLERPAFDEEIIAWKYGPVVPEVYFEFSMYGALDIDRVYEDDVRKVEADIDIANIAAFIILKFEDTSPIKLVNETHLSGSPWDAAYTNRDNDRKIIDKEKISKYFKKKYMKEWLEE